MSPVLRTSLASHASHASHGSRETRVSFSRIFSHLVSNIFNRKWTNIQALMNVVMLSVGIPPLEMVNSVNRNGRLLYYEALR